MKISRTRRRAFTLIEVVLSLGLITFCLTVLMGLIPVGLGAIQNSTQQAGAVNCLEEIDGAIRGATTNANSAGQYQALGMYSSYLSWTNNAKVVNVTFTNSVSGASPYLSLSGSPTAVLADQRLAAAVQITSPATSTSFGSAFITVAWPKTAKWTPQTMTWSNAQGSVSTWVIFTPTP
jgi:type II secretory pathway pseudopilin PulG